MLKLLSTFYIGFITIFNVLSFVLNFINKCETDAINNRFKNRIIVSTISGVLIGLLYIKDFASFSFIKFSIMIIFLAVIGYIDAMTRNVYSFINYIFIAAGIVFVAIDIMKYNASLENYIIGIVLCILICGIFTKAHLISGGDFEVFVILSFFIPGYLSIINIILTFFIAGISVLPLILLHKKKLHDGGALCPYIAVASYLLIIFML